MNIFNGKPLDFKLAPQDQGEIDEKRLRNTAEFMGAIDGPVLDLGPENEFGAKLAKICNISEHYYTVGDLDRAFVATKKTKGYFGIVWIFEVIEHLMNPNLMLNELKKICKKDARIFITYPYRTFRIFWSHNHYHEIDPLRFKALVEGAGYKIVRSKHVILYRNWKFYLSGIRPLLRLLFATYHHYYYELQRNNV